MKKLFAKLQQFFKKPVALEPVGPMYLNDLDLGNTSDGYHTFNELYEHRNQLWIALCKALHPRFVWKSKLHSDGTFYPGWFVLGYRMKHGKQITYHLPMSLWESCDFANTRNRAPKFDGHSSEDVVDRIKNLK
jgi:hypothetical protein